MLWEIPNGKIDGISRFVSELRELRSVGGKDNRDDCASLAPGMCLNFLLGNYQLRRLEIGFRANIPVCATTIFRHASHGILVFLDPRRHSGVRARQ